MYKTSFIQKTSLLFLWLFPLLLSAQQGTTTLPTKEHMFPIAMIFFLGFINLFAIIKPNSAWNKLGIIVSILLLVPSVSISLVGLFLTHTISEKVCYAIFFTLLSIGSIVHLYTKMTPPTQKNKDILDAPNEL